MTAWLPASNRLQLKGLSASRPPLAGASEGFLKGLRSLREILSILSRAKAAAHHYEDLKHQSGTDLAAKGLARADLPRAAFHKLTHEA